VRETGSLFRSIQFDDFVKNRDAELVECEVNSPFIQSVRFSKKERHVLRLVLCASEATPSLMPQTVFAIGGATGITLRILKDLIVRGTRHVYIVGRAASDTRQQALVEMRELGADVDYLSIDATDYDQLEHAFSDAVKKHGPIDMVIHGGGVEK